MDKVALLKAAARSDLFRETAHAMKTTPAIVEKDFWVVWTLDKLFGDATLQRVLKFKGGTSLSKAFGLIGRFSEDIDLILDWREVTGENPYLERNRTQQNKFNEATNAEAVAYVRDTLLPQVARLISPVCSCTVDAGDPHSISITYPSAFRDTYLRPQILLEIGPWRHGCLRTCLRSSLTRLPAFPWFSSARNAAFPRYWRNALFGKRRRSCIRRHTGQRPSPCLCGIPVITTIWPGWPGRR